MRKNRYLLGPYSSPKNNKRGCLCKNKDTYSRKCCKGELINQGIGSLQGLFMLLTEDKEFIRQEDNSRIYITE